MKLSPYHNINILDLLLMILSFLSHIYQLVKKLKLKLAFVLKIKSCFLSKLKRDLLPPPSCLYFTMEISYRFIHFQDVYRCWILSIMENWGLYLSLKPSLIISRCIPELVSQPCRPIDWTTGIYLLIRRFLDSLDIKKVWEIIIFARKKMHLRTLHPLLGINSKVAWISESWSLFYRYF